MSNYNNYTTNINEWTQVYYDGQIRSDKHNNLQEIVKQLDNGKRGKNQVYAILRGMGIDEDKALYAVSNFMGDPGQEPQRMDGPHHMMNNVNHTETENCTEKKLFNIDILINLLDCLKSKLQCIKDKESQKLNYSVNNVIRVTENYLQHIKQNLVQITELHESVGIEEKYSKILNRVNPIFINTKYEYFYAQNLLNELYSYKDLIPVNEFVKEITLVLEENKFTNLINNALVQLKNNSNNVFYNNIISDLEYLNKKDENYIRENLSVSLSKHAWLGMIKNIINECNTVTNKINETESVVTNRIFSPIQIMEDNNIVFAINNKLYLINNSATAVCEYVNYNELDPKFLNINKIFKGFKVTNERLELYNNNQTLDIILNENKVLLNNIEINHNDIKNFRNSLIMSKFFGLNEQYRVDELLYLIENLDSIKEVDYITNLKSRVNNTQINLIKLNENTIYINRINPAMGTNELVKVQNSKDAKELVNEYFNVNIDPFIYSILEKEEKTVYKVNEQKEIVKKQIKFLESKIAYINGKIQEVGINESFDKAIKILEDELKSKEIELQQLYLSENKAYIKEESVPTNIKMGMNLKTKESIFIPSDTMSKLNNGSADSTLKVYNQNGQLIEVERNFINIK